jgi:hypothetical protein
MSEKATKGNPRSRATWEYMLRTTYNDLNTLATALDTMATKLNNDGGVTDVDYAGADITTTT